MNAPIDFSARRACLKRLGAAAISTATTATTATTAAAITLAPWAGLAQAATLAKVKERGSLIVGIYHDMPPFHVAGAGIDVDVASALAEALGVKLSLLPFHADESMNDDLRNMVWRGHYLGYGPADVLMHVPVERGLMDANPQVKIFAPYYRERVVIARDLAQLPVFDAMPQLAKQHIAVPGQSIAGWLLLGADNGAYKNQLTTQWKDGAECARALQRGEVSVAAGLASELESVLRGNPKFAIAPMPSPRAPREGWAAGLAVKSDATDLAFALQTALTELDKCGELKQIFERHNVDWRAA